MNPFQEVNWAEEAPAFAAADELLALVLQREPASHLAGLQRRFPQFQQFTIPATTFSPMMLYSLYALAAMHRPGRVAVCGVDAGIATAALAAGAADGSTGPVTVLGSERDAALAEKARTNLALLGLPLRAEVHTGPAAAWLAGLAPGSVDLVLLDSWPEDHPALLPAVLRALSPRGLLLAHDPLLKRCVPDMERVSRQVEATGAFNSMTLPLDDLGLWVAVPKEAPCA